MKQTEDEDENEDKDELGKTGEMRRGMPVYSYFLKNLATASVRVRT
jgi:hypothetical protein